MSWKQISSYLWEFLWLLSGSDSEFPSGFACLRRGRGLCGLTDLVDLRNAVGRTFGVPAQAHCGRGCAPIVLRH